MAVEKEKIELHKGLKGLTNLVQAHDLCTFCGACMNLCPYIQHHRGRWIKLNDCDLPEGRCYKYCPRTEVDPAEIHQKIFGRPLEDIEIGYMQESLMAQATDTELQGTGQNGGVVSAIMDFCLSENLIDAALLTSRDDQQLPEGRMTRSREEILSCSGSSYIVSPTLSELNKIKWQEIKRVGVVGLPCQALALAKMRAANSENRNYVDRVNLVIGLFCTWALDYSVFTESIRAKAGAHTIRKLDITPPPERLLKVFTDNGVLDIPIDEIRSFIRPGCEVCLDMTAEFADISVGTVEGVERWNTVLLRTDRGIKIFNMAKRAGVITTKPLPAETLKHLRKASILKKYRALNALGQRGHLQGKYLKLSPELIRKIVSKAREAL